MKRTPPPSSSPEAAVPSSDLSSNQAQPQEASPSANLPEPAGVAKKAEPLSIPAILLEGDEPTERPSAAQAQVKETANEGVTPAAAALPKTYETGRLRLAARDPRWLYAHWDLSHQQQERYRELAENGKLALRVYRNTVGGPIVSEQPVGAALSHSFVGVDTAATKYVAELGYYPPGGAWKPVASSEPALTPPEKVSEDRPVEFATLRFQEDKIVSHSTPGARVTVTPQGEAGSSEPSMVEQVRRAEPEFPLPRAWRGAVTAAVSGVGRDDLPAVLPEPEEEMKGTPAAVEMEALKALTEPSPATAWPWFKRGPEPMPPRVWTEEKKQALWELSGWSSTERRQLGSEEIELLLKAKALQAAAELGGELMEREVWVSSLGLAGAPAKQQRAFWFNVNAELVIYGATEPDAAVTIGGRRIRLRPDGSFSYRFALPDGSYQLPLTARSKDGDERAAELSFYRGTRYGGEVGSVTIGPELKPPAVENID